jgi:phosphoribosylanthranilate isomerase
MTRIKVCGITRIEDALDCIDAGVDTLGLNFWSGTKRHVDIARATSIVEAVAGQVEIVAVFVDAEREEITRTLGETGITWAQLHGDESPELVRAFLPNAYKAIGVRATDASVQARAALYPGEHLLLDAFVPGAMPGGTGHTFDWALARDIARVRMLTLAGGLTPVNVAEAIRTVQPYRVDVASGVESAPGVKDPTKVRAFVAAARSAL